MLHVKSTRYGCLLIVLLALAGCGGGGGSDDGGGGNGGNDGNGDGTGAVDGGDTVVPPITVGSAGDESWSAALRWLDVVKHSDRFDECHGDDAMQCSRGARSGSALGSAVFDWAEDELAAIPELRFHQRQIWDFPVYKPDAYSLEVQTASGNFSPAVFPWYYTGQTGADGVGGDLIGYSALALGDRHAGKIVIVNFDPFLNAGVETVTDSILHLRDQGAAGVVAISEGPANQIIAQTMSSLDELAGIPVLIVGKQDGEQLRDMVGNPARLVLDARYETRPTRNSADASGVPVPGVNVMAYLPGADSSNIVVIGTPLNSLLLAAGERAPGAGIFVYLARYFAQLSREQGPPPYSIYFVATGGHEVYGYGLGRFFACLPTDRLVAYVHLGSGLVYQGYDQGSGEPVARDGMHQTRTLSNSENLILRSITDQAFGSASLQPLFNLPPSLFNPGEASVAYSANVPTISISGTNPYFHTAADDQDQIYKPALGDMALAYRSAVEGILATDADSLRNANVLAGILGGTPPQFECPAPLEAPLP